MLLSAGTLPGNVARADAASQKAFMLRPLSPGKRLINGINLPDQTCFIGFVDRPSEAKSQVSFIYPPLYKVKWGAYFSFRERKRSAQLPAFAGGISHLELRAQTNDLKAGSAGFCVSGSPGDKIYKQFSVIRLNWKG